MNESLAVSQPAARTASWKWWVCGLLLLATMINYMDRLTLNQTAKRVMVELRFDESGYGELESAFAYAFALGAILSGWMADRFNIRWLYPILLVAWSMAGFATGLVQGFLGLLACRFLLGLAEAGHWPCALRTTQRILSPAERSMGNSILQSGAAVGAVLTPLLILALPKGEGTWRYPFLIVGAAGMSWALLWLVSVRSADVSATQITRAPAPIILAVVLIALLGVKVVIRQFSDEIAVEARLLASVIISAVGIAAVTRWLFRSTADEPGRDGAVFLRRFFVLLVVSVMINATWHFFRAWLPLFLQNQHGYSETNMNWFLLAYYVSTDIGSLAAGFTVLMLTRSAFAVHGSRVAVFAFCAALCALGGMSAAFLSAGPLLLAMLLVVGFGALGVYPNYYSFTQELSAHHQGKVSGALGCSVWLSMAPVHEAVGEFAKGGGSYSMQIAIAALLPMVALAALLLWWGKESSQPDAKT